MIRIGPHVSIAGGLHNAPINARNLGATAFGMFTKNQRRWESKPLDNVTADLFKKTLAECGFLPGQVLPHAGYLINLGHPEKDSRLKSYNAFVDELQRCSLLGLPYLNIHPGSHLNLCSEQECIELIAQSINGALDETQNVTVVIENTAGQGSNIGYRFEHIAQIIDNVIDKTRIGVCIDTCHMFAAGYDLTTKDAFQKTMLEFENIIGFRFLRGVHLNDSKTKLGAKLDRHQSIGKGSIGLDPFKFIVNDERFNEIPLILETIDESLWAQEIKLLYSLEKK